MLPPRTQLRPSLAVKFCYFHKQYVKTVSSTCFFIFKSVWPASTTRIRSGADAARSRYAWAYTDVEIGYFLLKPVEFSPLCGDAFAGKGGSQIKKERSDRAADVHAPTAQVRQTFVCPALAHPPWYAYVASLKRSQITQSPRASAGSITCARCSRRAANISRASVSRCMGSRRSNSRNFSPSGVPPGSRVETTASPRERTSSATPAICVLLPAPSMPFESDEFSSFHDLIHFL